MRITKCIMEETGKGYRKDIGEDHPLVDASLSSFGTHWGGPWIRVHAQGTDGSLHTVRLNLEECDLITRQAAWTREQQSEGG